MFRFKYSRVAAAVLTFTIGVVVVVAVGAVLKVARIAELEQPPCNGCAQLYSTSPVSVSVCELKQHLEEYRGRIVRVDTKFHHDAGQVSLLDDACPKVYLHADLSDSCQSCIGARKALSVYSGFGTWYDSTARVVVLGRIGRLENSTFFEDENGFNIDCIESAEPIGSATDLRIKYTQGELFGLNPHSK